MRDAHFSGTFAKLHAALLDVVGIMNGPARDALMVREAGLALEPVLFPLLVAIARRETAGVVALADVLGRDYTTLSRQLGRLAQAGLVRRAADPADRRRNIATLTEAGRATIAQLDATRERLARGFLADWDDDDLSRFAELMRRFADALTVPRAP